MKTYMMETRLYSLYKLFLFFHFILPIHHEYMLSGTYFIKILIETGSLPFILSLEYKSCE